MDVTTLTASLAIQFGERDGDVADDEETVEVFQSRGYGDWLCSDHSDTRIPEEYRVSEAPAYREMNKGYLRYSDFSRRFARQGGAVANQVQVIHDGKQRR